MRVLIAVMAALVCLVLNPAQSSAETSLGRVGSGLTLRTIPHGYEPSESQCGATLAEVRSTLPRDYGTSWFWSPGTDGWAGLYFPGQDIIILSSTLPCESVPAVAVHEWVHQVQDANDLRDRSEIFPGVMRLELVAECAARVLDHHYGWTWGRSYPEITGIPCSEVSADVQALLARI